jgi:hypothetical protein
LERSITQAAGPDAAPDLRNGDPTGLETPSQETSEGPAAWLARAGQTSWVWGMGLVLICLAAYYFIQPNRTNPYLHFVLQAQSWLDGKTAILMPGYQDVMPLGVGPKGASCLPSGTDPSCVATGYGIIPFPPLPALVLLPFVSIWHLATNQQLLAAIFAAVDVGIAYWMLGYLRVSHNIRVLTALFFGLGTVLWYSAAIGTTWFWAHIVALACLLLSVGIALSADAEATEPEPLSDALAGLRRFRWPGGWQSLVLLCVMGAIGELILLMAGAGASAASLAAIGVFLGVAATALAVVAAGRPGALLPILIAVVVVGGLPTLLLISAHSTFAIEVFDAALFVMIVLLWWLGGRRSERLDSVFNSLWAGLSSPESRQVAAGLLFGLAVTARLTILLGLPFFLLVGGGGGWLRRGMLAGAGAAVPLAALLVYTYAATGSLFNPAYQYQYVVELKNYGGVLNYNPSWSITDIRYIPQNLVIMFLGLPRLMPNFAGVFPGDYGTQLCTTTSVRSLFDQSCPLALPDATGTSIILSSPAYLLAPLAWRPIRHLEIDRAAVGASVAVVAIAVANLMHFSQGWVQFGYRFSNDFAPFALILVALGASRLGRLWPLVLLVAAAIAINFWGSVWGVMLGW